MKIIEGVGNMYICVTHNFEIPKTKSRLSVVVFTWQKNIKKKIVYTWLVTKYIQHLHNFSLEPKRDSFIPSSYNIHLLVLLKLRTILLKNKPS